ncbi:hypothetical protein Ae168Ps1_0987 [Pseudonocardia sp. Ae168_Ps1]|uniref:hypothetical protein n=1 Tax=unclassified Pseudonocardia TaxID=2619320 RepID=UPI00094B0C5A|nr:MULTISPECIES: hypothetical protein [unclassified Pseudonocardia]OLL72609.1 hypothetical protein Ae150APs1_0987 [Pseudonocardia sp. Ae150A_Ps1]OLL78581.1 hypothetical protein Ae168Ps1_0987 [Pseudonocardia sp. Ae168_Ps1]OLL87293.1 hypothetical protein Ae263Ps1_4348c [Pseudonocardia sp. Ae263_Ps1]OLL92677.1 hypothetical protein Ae356Ps1_2574 [Pseudonocardia sp. Ae356_Ps1]
MSAPDVAGVVPGWRTWRVRDPAPVRLWSPVHIATEWPPDAPLDAACELDGHRAPDPGCTCGLYAARRPADVGGLGFGGPTVLGCVALWGTVVEGERGWRAGTGRPVVLFCGPALPEAERTVLASVYRIPVHRLPLPVAPAVGVPGIVEAAERVRTAAARTPPDPAALDDASRGFVAAVPRPGVVLRRPRRRFAVGSAVAAAVAVSALLVPQPEPATPPAGPAAPAPGTAVPGTGTP